MARSVEDCAYQLQALAGHDPLDPASSRAPVSDYLARLARPYRDLAIGVPSRDFFLKDADNEVAAAFEASLATLRTLGADVRDVAIPGIWDSPSFTSRRPGMYGELLRNRLLHGGLYTGAEYAQAMRLRERLRRQMLDVFGTVDLLATPTAPKPGPTFAEAYDASVGFPLSNMPPFNLSGLPALALPCGFTRAGLPISLQLAGRPFDDATVLRAGPRTSRPRSGTPAGLLWDLESVGKSPGGTLARRAGDARRPRRPEPAGYGLREGGAAGADGGGRRAVGGGGDHPRVARGLQSRAGPGARLGPLHRRLLPRHRARPALALRPRSGAPAGRLRVHPDGRAGSGRCPAPAQSLHGPAAAAADPAALRQLHLLLPPPLQAAFSFRPSLLVWTGLCGVTAWTIGFLSIVTRPETIVDPPGRGTRATMLATYLDPNYVSVLKYQNEIIVFLLVSAGLALLVRRSRTLVAERAEAERTRGNLARYFSPKVVETLAARDEPLGRVRRQVVGVLFADLVGFTTMAEEMTPEEVMALLRDFHGRMEEEVFRHGGCLEKFIGDALLATFGVPDTGSRDATDALACARGMQAAVAAWNREREAAGLGPLRIGLDSTTARWWPATSGAVAAWRSRRWGTRPTWPVAFRV